MDRYWVSAYGADENKLKVALITALEKASTLHKSAKIIVPALNSIEGTVLDNVIGAEAVNKLRKHESFIYPGKNGNVTVDMVSWKNFYRSIDGVLLLLWPSEDILEKVDAAPSVALIVALEWNNQTTELRNWAAKHRAIQLEA